MMGLTDSPYHACQAVMWANIVALGDRQSLKNPFVWYEVVVKFTGTTACDCKCPWVYKEMRYRLIAANLFVFVDDGQPIIPTETLCWEASRRWGSTCSWLGIQGASRKVQSPLQAPGPW